MRPAKQVGFFEVEDQDWDVVYSVYQYLKAGVCAVNHEISTLYDELQAMYKTSEEAEDDETSEDDEIADESLEYQEYLLSRTAVYGMVRFMIKIKSLWDMEKQSHSGPSVLHYRTVLRRDALARCIGAHPPQVIEVPSSPADRAPYVRTREYLECGDEFPDEDD